MKQEISSYTLSENELVGEILKFLDEKINVNNETIIINNITYMVENNNGKITLLRFNEKHKMWVKLNFRDVSVPNSIIKVLSKQYIDKMVNNM